MEMHGNSTIQSPSLLTAVTISVSACLSLSQNVCCDVSTSTYNSIPDQMPFPLSEMPGRVGQCFSLSPFPHFLACLPACQLLRSSIPRPPISFDFSAAFLRSSCLVFSPRFSHSSGSISISCLSVFSLPPSLPCLISYEIAPFSLSVFNRYINIRF